MGQEKPVTVLRIDFEPALGSYCGKTHLEDKKNTKNHQSRCFQIILRINLALLNFTL